MAQLVRMEAWEADLVAAAAQHHAQTRVGQAAVLTQPEPWQVGVLVAGAGPQIAVEGLAGAAAERQGALAPALPRTRRTSSSRSTSASLILTISPRRAPVSSSSMSRAVSRRP
jgi:hypothetical protein